MVYTYSITNVRTNQP